MLIARADEAVARIDLSAPEAIAVTRLPAPAGPIAAARESPDGRFIAAAARDVALLWRADSGALARTLRHVEGRDRAGPPLLITDLDFSPDSAQLLTAASDGVARRYPTAGGRPTLLRGHAGGLRLARFTAGGEQIVTVASDGVARAWELGARPRPLPPITLRALTTTIGALRHAARTNMLLGTPSGGAALLWSLDGVSEPTQLHGHTGSVVAARFDPSGEALATGSVDGSARLWSWATSPEVLRGHAQAAQQVTFLPGGALLSASLDGTARRWRPSERGDRRVTILAGHREGASVLARVSPDGDWIVTASADGSLLLWTGEGARASDEAGARVPGEPVDLALDRRGRVAVGTREGAVHLLRVAPAGRLRAGPRVDAGAPITRVRLAGDALLATTEDGRVQAWTLADDAPTPGLTRQEHAGAIRDLDVDVAGRRLVTAGDDGIARVLRLSSWEVDATVEVTALRGHEGPLWSARLDASGERLLTASSDGTARLWMTSADAPATILRGHTAAVWIALFDPAGTRALTSSADGTARLWSLPAGTSILLPHAGTAAPGERDVSVWSAAFSPDGALAATADDSGVIRLFPVAVEALLAGACLRAGRALTRDEWRDALGDRPYAPACR
ncbi:MAG: WD40 repeat domain-containing protein [Nannocystaceae bacterium]